jgi:Cu-Zn family superoxide dismutase
MIRSLRNAGSMFLLASLIVGCHHHHHHNHEQPLPATTLPTTMSMDQAPMPVIAVAIMKPALAATTQPTNNNVSGTVTFTQIGDSVKVVADITGLAPNTKHGFHIHQKPDLSSPDLLSAGGHFNPGHHMHGGPTTSPVHEGDLGNLTADDNGAVHYELTVNNITIGTGAANDILNHSVIIHAKPDDFSTQPTGNSGARVAGGVIELQK